MKLLAPGPLRLLLAVGVLMLAPIAHAGSQDGSGAEAWRGRYCTRLGCGPGPGGSAANVAGFGAAALGAAWLSRRRDGR